ncbi:hypothetical protein GQ55_9G433900 [Panicum hallii var. hallii]|uniref:Rx N-terminal domain-containing protein n=1 Tax=Panicum hallii var. hallii TaxID=1504633 RepID=A0A2T7CB45_9POAL|nr:hypothetical protein GQ55_9G433900 [Panicum hallii var. hallii]
MAEIVSSAVAEVVITQIVSRVLDKQTPGRRPSQEESLERLEMAHIKLEAALETSNKWRITDASLLRWRGKLKRAARECDDALRRCKRRAVEDEERRRAARGASFPARLARAARSFLSSDVLSGDDGGHGWSGPAVRRFEWYADGAAEFLRFVELGGTPRRYAFFDPLIARLLAGDELRYRLVRGSQYHLFCVRPIFLEGRGVEAKLIFIYEDDDAPEKNLCIGSMLRLSESTDIVGTTIKCLQLLVTPHFRSTAEAATRELASLPTQDFSWVPYADTSHKMHWNSIHRDMSQWFRPDPLCCSHQHRAEPCKGDTGATGLPEVSLESVIEVYWQCQIPLSEYNMRRRAIPEGRAASSKDTPHLKLGLLFTPHGSLGGVTPRAESSALEVIDGEEQHGAHTNLSLQQVDETVLPKALECLYLKAEATAYQMLWKSRHGAAYLQVKKTIPGRNAGRDNSSRRSLMQKYRHHQDPKLERWTHVLTSFLKLWVARAPERLRCSMVEWLQRANEKQQAVLQY